MSKPFSESLAADVKEIRSVLDASVSSACHFGYGTSRGGETDD